MSNQQQSYWDLSLFIGLPIGLVIAVGLVVLGFRMRMAQWDEAENPSSYSDEHWFRGFKWASWAAAVIALGITVASFYPWQADYLRWTSVQGRVDEVSSRLISAGDIGMAQRFVIVIDGQQYGIDDTRASLLKPGDDVSLMCKREWEYAAASGFVCRWGGTVVNR